MVPIYKFACIITTSPPNIQLQFLTESLAFTDITDLYDLYGQTVLDTVYYCIRTFVYYIHREKQILIGNWVGDLTVKTKNDRKITTYRQTHRPQQPVIYNISRPVILAGNVQYLEYDVTPHASAGAILQEDSISHPAAVSALDRGDSCQPDNVESSAALDCAAGVGE